MLRELFGFLPIPRVADAWERFRGEGGLTRPCQAQGAGQLAGRVRVPGVASLALWLTFQGEV